MDLHNLVPAVGQINAIRSDTPYGEIDDEERRFGSCDFESNGDITEPREAIRGDIARVWLYMSAVWD